MAAAALPAVASADPYPMGPGDITSGPLAISARQFTFVQIEDSKRFTLRAPTDGFVTSWSVNMNVGGQVKLLALSPNGDGTYKEGDSVSVNTKPGRNDFNSSSDPSASDGYTQPLRVSKGDALGLQLVGQDARVWVRIEDGGEFMARDDGNHTGGFTSWPGYYILFRAQVEPMPAAPNPPAGFPPDPTNLLPDPTKLLPDFDSGTGNGGGDGGGAGDGGGSSQPTAPPAPVVSGVSPGSGTTAGGEAVAISGDNFDTARSVYFGGSQARSFTVDGFKRITAITPAHSEGPVDVEVVNAGGISSKSAGSIFNFTAPVSVLQTAPSTAPPAAQPAAVPKPRVRCAHAPTLIGRTVSGARKLLRRWGCGSNLRIQMIGKRRGHARVKVRSQVPRPRAAMRADRRILIRVR